MSEPADLLGAAAVRGFHALFRALGWDASRRLARGVAPLLGALIHKKSALAERNLRAAFPHMSDEWVAATRAGVWSNMTQVFAELCASGGLDADAYAATVRFEHIERLERAAAEGKGVLLHAGHLGNWELVGGVLAQRGFDVHVVSRRVKNPRVDRWLTATRGARDIKLISSRNPFFACVRALKRRAVVGLMTDQNVPLGDDFIPFFGRQAAVSPLTAMLAAKTGAPIVPVQCLRDGDQLAALMHPPRRLEKTADKRQILAETAILHGLYETWIRERPADWLWLHNRWKREQEAPDGRRL